MKKDKKKNRKILFQIGLILIPLFGISMIIVANLVIISAFSTSLMNLRMNNESLMRDCVDALNSFEYLPWLLDFLTEHGSEMEIRDYLTEERFEEYSLELSDKLGKGLLMLTQEDVDGLAKEDQNKLAVAVYQSIQVYIDFLNSSGVNTVSMIREIPETDKGIILFDCSMREDGTYRLGDTIDLKEVRNAQENFEAASKGVIWNWFWRRPPKDSLYGFTLPVLSEKQDNGKKTLFYNAITGQDVYDSMVYVDGIRLCALILLSVTAAVILIALFFIVIKPLHLLNEIVTEYEKEKNARKTQEDISKLGSRNEIGVIADSFSSLSMEMMRYTKEVASLAGEKERVSTELNVATNIQKGMLPREFLERKEFSLYATMDPAREVGGDFYDFYMTDGDHLVMTMSDVSGKGIPAALFMAVSKTILKNRTMMGGTPAEILEEVNNRLCEGNSVEMFVTVWLGILTLSTGELIVANGGHEYPGMRLGEEPFQLIHTKHGTALGMMEGLHYRNEQYHLQPGDAVFLYTDGIPEAINRKEQMFTEERLENVLKSTKEKDLPEEIIGSMRKAVDSFVEDAEQFDDITMLCMIYKGPSA